MKDLTALLCNPLVTNIIINIDKYPNGYIMLLFLFNNIEERGAFWSKKGL